MATPRVVPAFDEARSWGPFVLVDAGPGTSPSAAEQGPYTPYRQLLMAVLQGLGERLGFTPSAAEQSRFADSVG
jgi:hypothetical protein